jgi:hypothetical protein
MLQGEGPIGGRGSLFFWLAVGPLRDGQRLAINIFLSSVELVQRIVTASPSHPCGMGLDFLTYRGQSCLKGSEFV